MKTFIYPEMMVHVALCTHKFPASVLLLSNDASLLEGELKRHREVSWKTVSTTDVLDALRNAGDKSADVILLDMQCSDSAALAHVNRVLKDDGLMVCKHPDLDDVEANKQLMQMLGNYFKIIMPYYDGAGSTLLLCSKEYHPTADVILQRSDLLEGHQFYNCDVHIGVFAMPQFIRKNYLGVIRN